MWKAQCEESGMIRISGGDVCYVTMPLFALMVMNQFCGVVPAIAELDNPFGDDWQALEKVAMISLLVQLERGLNSPDVVEVTTLRPAAELFKHPETSLSHVRCP